MTTETTYTHAVLLVDDERSILNALTRLLRRQGYEVVTAESGQAGIDILTERSNSISLIISDQRMPGMSGSQFLECAAKLAPDAQRFTLTGYSDINAVIDAVNKGKIHRYLTKPWNDDDLLDQVRLALDQVELRLENERLRKLTEQQNIELADLNQQLEKKVTERTWALQIQNKRLETVNRGLERSLMDAIKLLVSLVASSNPRLGTYMKAVSQLGVELAMDMGLNDTQRNLIEMAGLVHDIGLLGMPVAVIEKEPKIMTPEELGAYRQHPSIAALSLSSVDGLRSVSDIVRMHHEHWDGSGFPDGLMGDQIPVEVSVLSVAADFCTMVHLWPQNVQRFLSYARRHLDGGIIAAVDVDDDQLRDRLAEMIIERLAGVKYHLDTVTVFLKRAASKRPYQCILQLQAHALKEGMVLMQDLRLGDGRLLLNKGSVLSDRSIQTLRGIGDRELFEGTIMVAEPRHTNAGITVAK